MASVVANVSLVADSQCLSVTLSDATQNTLDSEHESKAEDLTLDDEDERVMLVTGEKSSLTWTKHLKVAIRLRPLMVALVLIYTVTLTIFPGVPFDVQVCVI